MTKSDKRISLPQHGTGYSGKKALHRGLPGAEVFVTDIIFTSTLNMKNAIAYYNMALVLVVKRFYIVAPWHRSFCNRFKLLLLQHLLKLFDPACLFFTELNLPTFF